MADASTNLSKISFWTARLNTIRNFPCLSSTHAALNLPQLRKALEAIHQPSETQSKVDDESQEKDKPVVYLIKGFSPEAVTHFVGMTVLTYIALNAFSTLSFYVNGAVGAGKIILSLAVALKDYKAAQNLFEEGFFHMITAVGDFAIAYFTLSRAVLSIGYGAAPEQVNKLYAMAYRPWSGANEVADDASQLEMNKAKKQRSWYQNMSDAAQRFVMPDADVGRIQGFIAALTGAKIEKPSKQ